MKKVLMILMAFCLIATPVLASDAVWEHNRSREAKGWSISGSDDDIGTSYELITELDTTYAQLAGEEAIEVLSASGSDTTQTVTVTGINSDGKVISEDFTLAGATVQTSSATFRYVDQATVDAECAGAITIRKKTGDTLVVSIPVGSLEATVIQHFNGEKNSYITGWRGSVTSTTGTIILQLREYPDDEDCLDSGDGFRVLDEIVFTNVLNTQNRPFPQPIRCPAGGWIAVFADGGTDNADASVTIQGYDTKY